MCQTPRITVLGKCKRQFIGFILVINQLDAQNLFYNKFISSLYMFRAPCAHRQEVKIVLYSLWYHHTYRWPSGAQVEAETCRGTKKLVAKAKFCSSSWLISKIYILSCTVSETSKFIGLLWQALVVLRVNSFWTL